MPRSRDATAMSFTAATLTMVISTALGTLAAYGMHTSRSRFTQLAYATFMLPLIIPGILIAIGITMLVGALVPSLPSSVPSWALITGFSVSVVVGVFFGVWPAVKAAQLDPVEALRYE